MAELIEDREAELQRIVGVLVSSFHPDRVFLFGSSARGTADQNSDLDLLVVVRDTGQYPHRLDQEAFRIIGPHQTPLDIMFVSWDEFEQRAKAVTSLPATVLREGRLLYAS